jgi:hypothetical protein
MNAKSTGPARVTLASDGQSQSASGTCTDGLGQTASTTFTGINIDKTAPTAGPIQTPTANGAGWNTTDVTVTWHWADNAGGAGLDPANCPASSTSTGEGGAIMLSATCADRTGNLGHASATVKVDKTAPTGVVGTPARPADSNGWYNAPVAVTFATTDTSLSGIASCTSPTYSGPDSATATVAGSCTDNAGNVGNGSFAALKYDTTKPTVSYSAHPATYTADQTVRITCTAADATSGVASSTCKDISGPAYSFPLGTNTFSASATDKAGNTGSGSTSFVVTVNAASLGKVIDTLVSDPSVAASLKEQANGIASAPNAGAKANKLQAYSNLVNAQTGKSITAANATILITLAKAL